MSSAKAAARAVAVRSVHLKINPVPQTFAARREVLRVIERFGPVEMFRSLKYSHTFPVTNAFISIFESEEAAREAINASPIQYRLIPHQQPPTTPLSYSSSSSSSPSPFPSPSSINDQSQSHSQQQEQTQQQEFTLSISSTQYPHEEHIISSPLYGPYPPAFPKIHPIVADLHTSIPSQRRRHKDNHASTVSHSSTTLFGQNHPSSTSSSQAEPPQHQEFNPGPSREGLCDWATDSLATRRAGAATLAVGGVDAAAPWRVRKKLKDDREREIPAIMKGLWVVWEEGRGKEKEREINEKMESEIPDGKADGNGGPVTEMSGKDGG